MVRIIYDIRFLLTFRACMKLMPIHLILYPYQCIQNTYTKRFYVNITKLTTYSKLCATDLYYGKREHD